MKEKRTKILRPDIPTGIYIRGKKLKKKTILFEIKKGEKKKYPKKKKKKKWNKLKKRSRQGVIK